MEVNLLPLVYYILEDPNSIKPEYREIIKRLLEMNLTNLSKQNITKLKEIVENLEKNSNINLNSVENLEKNLTKITPLANSTINIKIAKIEFPLVNLSLDQILTLILSFSFIFLLVYIIIRRFGYKLEKDPIKRYIKYLHSLGKKYYETNREFILKLPRKMQSKLWTINLEFEKLIFGKR